MRVRGGAVVILPWGATEAHGVHLPLGTDSIQPQSVADALAERIGGLVAPLVPYAYHSSTKNMPGTIDVSFDTVRALAQDILEALVRNGSHKILVIAGHASSTHMTSIKLACHEITVKHDVRIMFLSDYDLLPELADREGLDPHDGHAGVMETSRVMAVRPELVAEHRPPGRYVSHGYEVLRNPETCFPLGVGGDPADANGELGSRANQFVVDRLVDMISTRWGI